MSFPHAEGIVRMLTSGNTRIRQPGIVWSFLLLVLTVSGCSNGERTPPNAKPVVPVSGLVHINGKPAPAGVQIRFHAVQQDPQNATLSMATTNADGQFKAFTYQPDDGVPPGEYQVTFDDQSEAKPHLRGSPDLFKGRYSDPKKSEFKLSVPASGPPIDMGTIELKR
jgi:hypothetical protein